MSKTIQPPTKDTRNDNLVYLFHHIHHLDDHEVHHCGGDHAGVEYIVAHCSCGKHSIDKEIAAGDTIGTDLTTVKVIIEFSEKCPDGGWHLESGKSL